MSSNTNRLGLLKKNPATEGNDTFNIETMLNENWEKIDNSAALIDPITGKLLPGQENVIDTSGLATDAELLAESEARIAHQADYVQHPGAAASTNSGNAYSVTLNPAPTAYVDRLGIVVTINADSTGASTLNVNGLGAKGLKKANGNDVTNLKANGVYTFRYNSTTGNFILQGEGGSGTATAADILSGKTAATDTGDVTGSMPNNGALTITPSASAQSIPVGYHNGSGNVSGVVVPAANVLTGTTIAGTAGTMANRGAMAITPGTTNQIIPAGYHNGSGIVSGDTNLIAANILSGKSIFNVAGTVNPLKQNIRGNTLFASNILNPLTNQPDEMIGMDSYFDNSNNTFVTLTGMNSLGYVQKKVYDTGGTLLSTTNIGGNNGMYTVERVRKSQDKLFIVDSGGFGFIYDINGTFIAKSTTAKFPYTTLLPYGFIADGTNYYIFSADSQYNLYIYNINGTVLATTVDSSVYYNNNMFYQINTKTMLVIKPYSTQDFGFGIAFKTDAGAWKFDIFRSNFSGNNTRWNDGLRLILSAFGGVY
jgi:hypothetical protein